MSIEAKKIEIIEAVLQIQNEEVLTALINNIHSSGYREKEKSATILSVAGSLSNAEAEELKQIIGEHFEKISPDDWK